MLNRHRRRGAAKKHPAAVKADAGDEPGVAVREAPVIAGATSADAELWFPRSFSGPYLMSAEISGLRDAFRTSETSGKVLLTAGVARARIDHSPRRCVRRFRLAE